MKNILVATDFSTGSKHALDHALALHKLYTVPIHLVHHLDDEVVTNPEAHSRMQAQFDTLRERHSAIASAEFVEGELLEQIQQHIDTHQIDLLVIGSFGLSGKKRYFIGSKAQRLIRSISCPVLTASSPIEVPLLQQIVYASDFDLNERAPFQYFLQWIQPQRPELHLLTIHKDTFFSPPKVVEMASLMDFEKMAQPLVCHRHLLDHRSVEEGIRQFARSVEADMIVMANTSDQPLRRLFTGSYVEAVILSCDLPVLTINLPEATN